MSRHYADILSCNKEVTVAEEDSEKEKKKDVHSVTKLIHCLMLFILLLNAHSLAHSIARCSDKYLWMFSYVDDTNTFLLMMAAASQANSTCRS